MGKKSDHHSRHYFIRRVMDTADSDFHTVVIPWYCDKVRVWRDQYIDLESMAALIYRPEPVPLRVMQEARRTHQGMTWINAPDGYYVYLDGFDAWWREHGFKNVDCFLWTDVEKTIRKAWRKRAEAELQTLRADEEAFLVLQARVQQQAPRKRKLEEGLAERAEKKTRTK